MIRRAIVGCENSGKVRDALIRRGIDAISVDLLPTEAPGPHHVGDLLAFLEAEAHTFDLGIFHPPCTYLTGAANRWLYHPDDKELPVSDRRPHPDYPNRRADREAAADFAEALWRCPIPRVAIENPRGYLSRRLGLPTQTIQPHHFGADASKGTCLWLRGLMPLQATARVRGRIDTNPRNGKRVERFANQTASGQNALAPGADRWKLRSQTYDGIAEAMPNNGASASEPSCELPADWPTEASPPGAHARSHLRRTTVSRYPDVHPHDINPATGRPYDGYSSPAIDTSFHDAEMAVDDDPEAIVEAMLSKRLSEAVNKGMTAEQAAKALHAVLVEAARECGQKPELEVMIRKPGEERFYAETRCWCVAWEAGPYQWAIGASMEVTAAGHLCEPYMGFDLMLFPSEWPAAGEARDPLAEES